MPIVRPRLTDYHGILLPQAQADFAIPFLDEDIPLYLDPFLLWRSPSQQDNALHTAIINSFNHLGYLEKQGKHAEAVEILTTLTECDEVGFGHSHTREGRRIGRSQAEEILQLFRTIPDYDRRGFTHFEEIQFFVDHISRDRISDIGCNLLKSFLIDYTIHQCQQHRIPTTKVSVPAVYSYRENKLLTESAISLPTNPENNKPSSSFPSDGSVSIPGSTSASTSQSIFPRRRPRPQPMDALPSSLTIARITAQSATTLPRKSAPPRIARMIRSSARFPLRQPRRASKS